MRLLSATVVLAAVLCAASPASAAPVAVVSSRELSGIGCPGSGGCWAVGSQMESGVTRTLIEHWNGQTWSVVASPSVAGSPLTFLSGISCPSGSNCWAVGGALIGSTPNQEPIVEHWNGRKWSLTALPEPSRLFPASTFAGVSCPSGTRCWAVGSMFLPAFGGRPLAEHWAAGKWSVVRTADYGSFSAVNCRRDANCWAVGAGRVNALAEHWNGQQWSVAPTPSTGGGLADVSCPGADCLATGNSGYPSAIAEKWNGTKWSITPTAPLPLGSISTLPGVTCLTLTDCFAVGVVNPRTLIEHWQGSKWVRLPSPNPAGAEAAELNSVFCTAAPDCWAVGNWAKSLLGGSSRTLAEHWNGGRWAIVATP